MSKAEGCKAARRRAISPRKVPASPRAGKAKTPVDAKLLARWILRAGKLPPVRKELVQRIKREIAEGTYETPEKLEVAVERMLEELGQL